MRQNDRQHRGNRSSFSPSRRKERAGEDKGVVALSACSRSSTEHVPASSSSTGFLSGGASP